MSSFLYYLSSNESTEVVPLDLESPSTIISIDNAAEIPESNDIKKNKVKRQKKLNKEQEKMRSEDSVVPFTRSDKMKRQIIHHARFLKHSTRSRANTLNDSLSLPRSENASSPSTLYLKNQTQISIQRRNDPIKRLCNIDNAIKQQLSPKLTKSTLKQKAYRAAQMKKDKEVKSSVKFPKAKQSDKIKAISLDPIKIPPSPDLKTDISKKKRNSLKPEFRKIQVKNIQKENELQIKNELNVETSSVEILQNTSKAGSQKSCTDTKLGQKTSKKTINTICNENVAGKNRT